MFRLALIHRCVVREAPRSLSEMLTMGVDVGGYRTRGENKLFLPAARSETFRRTFMFRGLQEWNSLPNEMRTMRSRARFKKAINGHEHQLYFS